MIDRPYLQDKELEKSFLSTILSEPDLLDNVMEKVSIEDFTAVEHADIFKRIAKEYFDKGKISRTRLMLKLSKEIGKKEVENIISFVAPFEIDDIVEQLNAYTEKRKIFKALIESNKVLENTDIDINKTKSQVEDKIFNVTSRNKSKEKLLYTAEEVAVESFEKMVKRLEGIKEDKIKTGYSSLDLFLNGGLTLKQLSVLAAVTSMGKTAFSLNLIRSIMESNPVPTLIFSLEMEKTLLFDRLLLQRAKVRKSDFYNKPTKQQRNAFEIARDWLYQKPLMITDERGFDIAQIKAISRKANNYFNNELKLIVVDYLSEIDINVKDNRLDKAIGNAVRELRNLSGELNCHVILIHQLNREINNRSNPIPRLSDLRDSGEIEQKADIVAFIHRPAYIKRMKNGGEEPLVQKDTELIIAKHRNGKTGALRYVWYPEIQYFQSYIDQNVFGDIGYLKNEGREGD
jgi:replicative DNA helicase